MYCQNIQKHLSDSNDLTSKVPLTILDPDIDFIVDKVENNDKGFYEV